MLMVGKLRPVAFHGHHIQDNAVMDDEVNSGHRRHRAQSRSNQKPDWIIDLGPEGGEARGEVIAQGTPEDVAENEQSFTGYFLKRMFLEEAASAEGSIAHRSEGEDESGEGHYGRKSAGLLRPLLGIASMAYEETDAGERPN
jgi:hypothetical protein